MPLLGDAFVGLAAVLVVVLLLKRPFPAAWLIAVVWSALAILDALAAFVVETTAPWPEFFMIEVFGRSMFFAAIAMHIVILVLLLRPDHRSQLGLSIS
jgi:hypothetical protein